MDKAAITARLHRGDGFIAALDQSGGSTPGALRLYGIPDDAMTGEADMFRLIHDMRVRILTAPSFSSGRVLGAILFERTMEGEAAGAPVPEFLHAHRVVPFLKVDLGLEPAKSGVRLMKPIPTLDDLLGRAVKHGIYGTKMRSVIESADADGIAAIVEQQFEIGHRILAAGLVPIIEPEVSIKAPDKREAEQILSDTLRRHLDRQPADRPVMLKLTLPTVPDFYRELAAHDRVVKIVALSGGYPQAEACDLLATNHDIIASFSRALIDDLRASMDDAEFDRVLGTAIERIYRASSVKRPVARAAE